MTLPAAAAAPISEAPTLITMLPTPRYKSLTNIPKRRGKLTRFWNVDLPECVPAVAPIVTLALKTVF